MAPRRAVAKRAAGKLAPPPPPPPAESSDDTHSRSRSDESEDEEAIAQSPTPALKNSTAPPHKGDEEEEEEEDQPARALPKNQPPPPQKEEDSDTAGSDDDEEEEDEEAPTRAAPPSAPKKPAPVKEASTLKPPALAASANKSKNTGAINRIWSLDDEVLILEAVAAHQKQHGGAFPQPGALIDVLAGKLDNPAYGTKELHSKVGSLRHRYLTLSKRGGVPSKEHDRRILDLSKIVWGGHKTTTAATNKGHDQKGFEEMCELYPYLAEEVKKLEAAHPGMYKRKFGKMDSDKAHAMDNKIKKQRLAQIRLVMRRADLVKEVTKTLTDLVDG